MNASHLVEHFDESQWLQYLEMVEQIGSFRMAYTIVMLVIFIAGMVGNVVTCLVIYCDRSMHTVTNYYLFDLAVSDIMVLLSMVIEVIYNREQVSFLRSDGDCRWKFFMVGALWNNGILIMTAVAMERYAAIVYPLLARKRTVRRRVPLVMVGVWLVAMLETLPDVFTSKMIRKRHESVCFVTMTLYSRVVNAAAAVVTFLLPLAVMVYVHVVIAVTINARRKKSCDDNIFNHRDNRKRVNKLIIALTLSFLVCWLPFFSVRVVIALGDLRLLFALTQYWELWYEVMSASALSSAVFNPLLFSLMSTKFRKALKNQWHTKVSRRNTESVQSNVTFDQ